MERRESNREELGFQVEISMEDGAIMCTLINLSEVGALLRINPEQNGIPTNDNLGEDVNFVLKQASAVDREYTGEIIRLFYKDNAEFIALRFWEKYKELN
ncbi:hypothetical protein LCGC14_3004230 [marine sediment metagenome]|uniref:PilZ domain-containing protein n=1 Tax=marine sediment metagenome TaxID=412755 RepID=A0A0F8X0M3_9ZZZZ|nr:PilZ domain-containing protein [Spirochaetales bacterium]